MIRVRLSLQFPALEAGVRQLLRSDSEIVVVDEENGPHIGDPSTTADVHIMTSAVFARQQRSGSDETEDAAILLLGMEGIQIGEMWARSTPWGIVPPEVSPEELSAAVRAVAAGLVVGPGQLLSSREETPIVRGPLTEREVEILGMLSRGLANKQVAAELGISEHTVKFHVSSIYTKLNVGNRTEAVREGLRNGWIAL